MVEHQVHDYAGDADVEPDGEGPAGDAAVLVEAGSEAAVEGHYRKRGNGGGQEGVRGEDAQVYGADRARFRKADRRPDSRGRKPCTTNQLCSTAE